MSERTKNANGKRKNSNAKKSVVCALKKNLKEKRHG